MTPQATEQPPVERVDHTADTVEQPGDGEHAHGEGRGWQHWGLMALCCLPMVAILLLVVLGVWAAR